MTLDNYLRDLLHGSELASVNIVNDNAATCDIQSSIRSSSSSGNETPGRLGRAQSLYSMAPGALSGAGRNQDHQTSRWQNIVSTRRMNSDSTLGKPKRRGSAEIQSIDVWKCMQNEALDTCLAVPSRGRSSPMETGSDDGLPDSSPDRPKPPARSLSDDLGPEIDAEDVPIGQPRRRSSSSLLASLGPMAPTRTSSGSIATDNAKTRRRSSGSDFTISEQSRSSSTTTDKSKVNLPKRPEKKRLVRSPTPGNHKNGRMNDNTSRTSSETSVVTEDEDSGPLHSNSPDPASPSSHRGGDSAYALKVHQTSAGGGGSTVVIPVGSAGTTCSQGFPKSLRELPYVPGQSCPPGDEELVATAANTIEG